MAYSNDIRMAVKHSYVDDRFSLKQSSRLHNVNYQTARAWKKKDEQTGKSWDKARAAQSLSAGNASEIANRMIGDQLLMHQEVIQLIKSDNELSPIQKAQTLASLSDSLSKTLSSFKKVTPSISELAVALDTLKFQADFIKQFYPHLIESFMEILEPLGEELSTHYGD